MHSSQSPFPIPSSATNDQDEGIARKKLEQKRRFQQKQGNAHTNADSLMQSMFMDLKLQPKPNTQTNSGKYLSLHFIDLIRSIVEFTKPISSISGIHHSRFL